MDEKLRFLERNDAVSVRYFNALLRSGRACLDYVIVGGDSFKNTFDNMNGQCATADYCLHPSELTGGVEKLRPLTFVETLESALSDCEERDLYGTCTAVMRYPCSNRLKIVQNYQGLYDSSAKSFDECDGVELNLTRGTNLSTVNDVRTHELWKALVPDDSLRERFAGFIDKKIRFSSKTFYMPTIREGGVFYFQITFGRLQYAVCSPQAQGCTFLVRKLRRSGGGWFYPLKEIFED